MVGCVVSEFSMIASPHPSACSNKKRKAKTRKKILCLQFSVIITTNM